MQNLPIFRQFIPEFLILSTAMLAMPAFADHADRTQPVHIEADKMTADDLHKNTLFEGTVILTQGTIRLTADHMTVREDPSGFKFASAFGNPVTFRQKREGLNEWVKGSAQHAEYNGKLDRIELFDHADVHRDKDEIKGDYLSYDTKSEVLQAHGHEDAKSTPFSTPSGRVHVTLQPGKKQETEPSPAAPPTPGTNPITPVPKAHESTTTPGKAP